jgi:hypothetical protein
VSVHLFTPPSMRRLDPSRLLPGPGLRHAALEYDLAAEQRPALLVDLGAGDAASFFAYCQAMIDHDVDGTCYAVDAWPDGLDAIRAHGRRHYPGISYFVTMPPGEALRHFDEETIDLLRVDATRRDVIADADVEAWLRRVRPGGLVVWHGAVEEPGLWSVVASGCATAVFPEGRGGLGLARKSGPPPQTELLRLVFVEEEAASLRDFYDRVHEHVELTRILDATNKQKA